MKVCLNRHGETAWSLSGRHTGVTDGALTARGEVQSRALRRRLQSLGFTCVLVSPRLWSRQTCALAGFGTTCEIEPELAEWDYGAYEGRRSDEIQQDVPGWHIWRSGCPGGAAASSSARGQQRAHKPAAQAKAA